MPSVICSRHWHNDCFPLSRKLPFFGDLSRRRQRARWSFVELSAAVVPFRGRWRGRKLGPRVKIKEDEFRDSYAKWR